jgi:hypothetical protein
MSSMSSNKAIVELYCNINSSLKSLEVLPQCKFIVLVFIIITMELWSYILRIVTSLEILL